MGRGASDSHWLIGSPQILCLLLYLALLLLPQIWRKLMLMALFQFAGVTNEVQSTTDSGLKNEDSFFFLTFLEAEVPDQGATSMVSSEASLLGLWVAPFSPCLHLVVPLSAC